MVASSSPSSYVACKGVISVGGVEVVLDGGAAKQRANDIRSVVFRKYCLVYHGYVYSRTLKNTVGLVYRDCEGNFVAGLVVFLVGFYADIQRALLGVVSDVAVGYSVEYSVLEICRADFCLGEGDFSDGDVKLTLIGEGYLTDSLSIDEVHEPSAGHLGIIVRGELHGDGLTLVPLVIVRPRQIVTEYEVVVFHTEGIVAVVRAVIRGTGTVSLEIVVRQVEGSGADVAVRQLE